MDARAIVKNTKLIVEPDKRWRSPLRYPGGKQKAITQIAAMLPAKAREFREPLVGGGSVYFHARSINFAVRYWINDQFEELMAFWGIVQDPKLCTRLMKELEHMRSTFADVDEIKQYYLKSRKENPKDLYRKALLFFFFNRVSFSGTTRAGGFSSSASLLRFTASSINRLLSMPEALNGAIITSVDYSELIESPGEDVFLFLDPPYISANKLYGKNGALHELDHEHLARLLRKTRHRFLLTYDDSPEVRKLYKWANIIEWRLQYGMNNCNANNVSKVGLELFIKNY